MRPRSLATTPLRPTLALQILLLTVLGIHLYQFESRKWMAPSVLSASPSQDITEGVHAHFPGVPVRLRIPTLGIESTISPVGVTPWGDIDSPRSAFEAGWFSEGVRPGERGNAVIAGHYDTATLTPGLFYDLTQLLTGDKILIEDAVGAIRTFRVEGSETYPYNAAPFERVFGAADGMHLNLIALAGNWNEMTSAQRLVVYTTLVGE